MTQHIHRHSKVSTTDSKKKNQKHLDPNLLDRFSKYKQRTILAAATHEYSNHSIIEPYNRQINL